MKCHKWQGGSRKQGERQLGSLVNPQCQFRGCWRGAAGEVLIGADHSSNLPLPGDLRLDSMKYTFLAQQCSLACHLPHGLCIHHVRTKAEWGFTFENPLVFYFLPTPSQHLLEKKCCAAESFSVCECAVHTVRLSLWVILPPPTRPCCRDPHPAQREDWVRSVGEGQAAYHAQSHPGASR